MSKRVYIAGPMHGRPEYNYPAFHMAAKRLRAAGHFVINPAELSELFGKPDEINKSYGLTLCADQTTLSQHDLKVKTRLARSLMAADLAAVRSCEAIYLLKGWESSVGARTELRTAIKHGLEIIQEK